MGKISIIVPIYKVEAYLTKCIDSIINQTYKDLEIILVDDGSPDNCPSICDHYFNLDHRIIVLHQENQGISSARNAGLSIATGNYILFLDSDDWIEKDMCEYLLHNAVKYNADISSCGYFKIKPNATKIKSINKDIFIDNKEKILEAYLGKKYFGFNVWNKLFKKDIINVQFEESLAIGEDAYFLYKLILNSETMIVGQEPKYNYLIRDNSATKSGFNQNSLGTIEFISRVSEDIAKTNPGLNDRADILKFNEYLAVLNKMIYFNEENQYRSEYESLVSDLKKIVKSKTHRIRISGIKKIAFFVFLINKNLYSMLLRKYYSSIVSK